MLLIKTELLTFNFINVVSFFSQVDNTNGYFSNYLKIVLYYNIMPKSDELNFIVIEVEIVKTDALNKKLLYLLRALTITIRIMTKNNWKFFNSIYIHEETIHNIFIYTTKEL